MKQGSLTIFRSLTAVALTAMALLNIWHFIQNLSFLKPRSEDAVVIWENRLIKTRNALIGVHYLRGDVGFMPVDVLRGNPRTVDENTDWVQARYGMIPWNLLQDTLAPRYVITDLSRSRSQFEVPPGFVTVYESGDGLVLLQRISQ